jgi:hypothetical protein
MITVNWSFGEGSRLRLIQVSVSVMVTLYVNLRIGFTEGSNVKFSVR